MCWESVQYVICKLLCFWHMSGHKTHIRMHQFVSLTECLIQMNMVFIWPFQHFQAHYLVVAGKVFTSAEFITCVTSLVVSRRDALTDLCPLWPYLSLALSVNIVRIDVFICHCRSGGSMKNNTYKIIMHWINAV